MNKLEYFERICYGGSTEKADLDTLTAIFQHHIRAIPFENVNIYFGKPVSLDLQTIFEKLVRKKQGGCCWEHNYLFLWVVKEMGYNVTLIGSNFYIPEMEMYSINISHPMLAAVIDAKTYIFDAGSALAYQMWQPIEVVSGKEDHQIPGTFCLTEKKGFWYLDKIKNYQHKLHMLNSGCKGERKTMHILFFTLRPRSMEYFQPICTYLQTHEDAMISNVLTLSLQLKDGYIGLFDRKLTKVTYNYKEDSDLVEAIPLKEEELEKHIVETFTINLEKNVPIVLCTRK
ncbi:arylamine N-acetyltransferase, pineal gland isozyme NAT-3-like [Ambystoma mexicanum]|uniref:arylamine N-acetyltransferase, pineal gland isozyme NAT-3-like n=1 Tax=Ambystoma mexicanum TaxID=8296 RepID=UPI0037E822F5